ncbi:hypothetical protein [Streptomyces parvulus]|uniref:hypothetical protein n=1 Tax=Streptomyces parvulus TaxID=146923 RepID=UPI0037F39DB6
MTNPTADRARAHGAHHLARLADLADLWRQLRDAFWDVARTVAETLHALADAVKRTAAALPARTDRPAWASPYGPPPQRRR